MILVVAQGVPNVGQFEDKSLHRALARKRVHASKLLGIATRAVDGYGAFGRFDQPCQSGTARDPFLHLLAKRPRTVTGRTQFNDEIRTKMPEAFALGRIHLLDAGLQRPGRIGRTSRSVGQPTDTPFILHFALITFHFSLIPFT